jgi:hypothetical protein
MEQSITDTRGSDLNLTFMFLNHLNAGFQASYIGLRFLRDCGSTAISDQYFTYPVSMLGKISGWIIELSRQKPLLEIKWTEPQSNDAKEAFSALDTLKTDLINWQAELNRIFLKVSSDISDEDIRIIISQYARCTYAQAYFLRGLLFFGKALGAEQTVDELSKLAPNADADLNTTHKLLQSFKENPKDNDLRKYTREIAHEIPLRFAAQIHDINILLSTYDNGFTYERAGVPNDEIPLWASRGFQPVLTSYWRSNGFSANEAEAWHKAGVQNAVLAREWRRHAFTPETAVAWILANVNPIEASKRTANGEKPPQPNTSTYSSVLSDINNDITTGESINLDLLLSDDQKKLSDESKQPLPFMDKNLQGEKNILTRLQTTSGQIISGKKIQQ